MELGLLSCRLGTWVSLLLGLNSSWYPHSSCLCPRNNQIKYCLRFLKLILRSLPVVPCGRTVAKGAAQIQVRIRGDQPGNKMRNYVCFQTYRVVLQNHVCHCCFHAAVTPEITVTLRVRVLLIAFGETQYPKYMSASCSCNATNAYDGEIFLLL